MPNKSNPVTINLRFVTVECIEKLYLSGMTYSKACMKVYNLARKKQAKTGFPMYSFTSFYTNYKTFKSATKDLLNFTTPTEVIDYD